MQLNKDNNDEMNIEMSDVTLVNKGDKQNIAHQVILNTSNSKERLCRYYNKGYCKFKSTCTNVHSIKTCSQINCRDKRCMDRHPADCRYREKCRWIIECLYQHNIYKFVEEKIANNDSEFKRLNDESIELKIEIKKLIEENSEMKKEILKIMEENR